MTRDRFRTLVAAAIDGIPPRFAQAMSNIAVVVEDAASPDLLAELEMDADEGLFGLYQGTPLPERDWAYGNTLPDRITLYQRTIEDFCDGDEDCRGDAKCMNQVCLGKDQSSLDTPDVNGEGYSALSAPDGTPISIKTTVITLNALPSINARIAYAGGGANINVSSGDPEAFRLALKQAMSPNFKCRPEDIE